MIDIPIKDVVMINRNQTEASASKHGMFFDTVHASRAYLSRLQQAAALNPFGWVLLLEDDVHVFRPVYISDLQYDICGSIRPEYSTAYDKIIKAAMPHDGSESKENKRLHYGGFGGHFINSSRLIGLRDEKMLPLISDLLRSYSPIASDELLSAVILQDGGRIGTYSGFYEFEHGRGVMKTHHSMTWLYGF